MADQEAEAREDWRRLRAELRRRLPVQGVPPAVAEVVAALAEALGTIDQETAEPCALAVGVELFHAAVVRGLLDEAEAAMLAPLLVGAVQAFADALFAGTGREVRLTVDLAGAPAGRGARTLQ